MINSIFSDSAPKRLDVFVSEQADVTRSRAAALIAEGCVLVGGGKRAKNYLLKSGDSVEIILPEPVSSEAEPENIPLHILFEDSDMLVVYKPKGMVVHPAAGNSSGTLVNALLYHCEGSLSGIGGVTRPGILHRIDKDTSGLLMVAKNDTAHNYLAAQIKDHSFYREYEAVVHGEIKCDRGRIEAPIGRHPVKRKQMAVTEKNSKDAITEYEVIKRYSGFTHVRLRLHTGRTHQIRVHMAYIGHPVAGDEVYGPKKAAGKGILSGQCLHARRLGFNHPKNGEYMEFSSELPQYFTDFLKQLEEKANA
ncbi:MAG: RluA family pseudouridine synthase [Clostridia bacterium]|nr:RluA family pseudouridine synthase [Clostridia bacterium]